ncbi:MAG TPA: DUF1579 family protein [Allosphingosinicella sp.]
MISIAFVAALMLAVPGAPGSAPNAAQLGPMAELLAGRVGRWCVEAHLRLRPEAPALSVAATADGRFLGGRWLVTELHGMGFSGLGVNGYDPQRALYTGYWIDGTRGIPIPVEGRFDPATGIFRTVSRERGADGRMIEVSSETRRISPDEEITRFTAPDGRGGRFERMVLRYRRAAPGAECPARPAP